MKHHVPAAIEQAETSQPNNAVDSQTLDATISTCSIHLERTGSALEERTTVTNHEGLR